MTNVVFVTAICGLPILALHVVGLFRRLVWPVLRQPQVAQRTLGGRCMILQDPVLTA